MTVRVRFAPSPTGYLHVGGARTALFNALYAKKNKGTFILRIEDTDRVRSTKEAIQAILDGMTWLGLTWDEGPFFQTERFPIYQEKIDELLRLGKAYPCFCTIEDLDRARAEEIAMKRKPKYRGTCRDLSPEDVLERRKNGVPESIRFKAPLDGDTVIKDALRGEVRFANQELDDLILRRASDGYPTYNFTVVVDDALMGMTHVIRGDDHLNNTPRQAQLYEALGYPVPIFAHVPMILGSDKQRLSKRHGATSVLMYRDLGYLPEAMRNYLVRLGWGSGDQELFTDDEMIDRFGLEGLNRSPAVFDPDKLLWMNGVYIRKLSPSDLSERVKPYLAAMGVEQADVALLEKAVAISQEKVKTLVELAEMLRFFFIPPTRENPFVAEVLADPAACERLGRLVTHFSTLAMWTHETIKSAIETVSAEQGLKLKDFAQPLRLLLAGSKVSPGIFEVLDVLGKDQSLTRLSSLLH